MNFKRFFLAATTALSLLSACQQDGDLLSESTQINSSKKHTKTSYSNGHYASGVFMVNEGWFGHENGSVHFWDRNSTNLQTNSYQFENQGQKLGVTTQFATIQNGHIYFVSKGYGSQKGNVIVANSSTLKREGTIILPSGQCRAFAAKDANIGYLSTGGVGTGNGSGIYKVNLRNYQIQNPLQGIGNEEVGNLLIANNKLFALKANSLLIINTSNDQVLKTISFSGKAGGMVKDKNGIIWVAANNQLVKINPYSLSEIKINLSGVSVNPSYGWAWNAGSLTYSEANHSLYFVNGGGWAPKQVACYHIDSKQSQNLFTIDAGWQIYGAGTYVDPIVNKLYVTALKGFGQNGKYNRLYVYNLNGSKEKVLDYNHFYFTALCVAQ
jgi:hypothetical protein